jgi:single-strand DNA-binding protein
MPHATTSNSQAPTAGATEPAGDGQQPRRRSGPALNRVQLIGRLAIDPELRYTSTGIPVARLRVATNEAGTVEYHDVVVWRQVAEFAGTYLAKGRLVFVEGHLRSRTWDGQDGVRRRSTEVVAADLQVLTPRVAEGEATE